MDEDVITLYVHLYAALYEVDQVVEQRVAKLNSLGRTTEGAIVSDALDTVRRLSMSHIQNIMSQPSLYEDMFADDMNGRLEKH
jgi:hypothetical protein